MGDGYGPLLIEKQPNVERRTSNEQELERLRHCLIAVPGTMTSAFLALKLYLGEFNYVVVPFDQIFQAVGSGRADAGLIIHEGQLTYARSGLAKLIDLGEWWKNRTGLPLPLGANVLRRDIPLEIQSELSAILRESIEFGLAHRPEAVQHSMPYARDMDSDLTSKFIGMMGHSLGAAGAIEAAVTLLALQHQFLPPNINFRESDLSLNVVANEARDAQFDCAVSNSFGFGGTNATIVFRKFAR